LRKSDNLYTIALVDPLGQKTTDLFPGEDAKTDDFAGQKAILDWVSEGRLRVLVSCGLDCMQRIDFGTLTGLSSPVGDPTQRSQDLWSVTNNHPEVIPTEYENLPGQLNWSPDGNFIAYIDERDNAWVINPADSTLYPLDIGTYSAAAETDWSFDGKYLAVRADQDLHIYKFDCP
jgi:Tol biopolymer transport system component